MSGSPDDVTPVTCSVKPPVTCSVKPPVTCSVKPPVTCSVKPPVTCSVKPPVTCSVKPPVTCSVKPPVTCSVKPPVTCSVKPPVYLQIGDTKMDAAHSGVCVVDVNLPFGKPVNIEEITFKNYYTAYVTVRLLRRGPGQEAPAKWCTALRDLPLMDNPHTEGGSQDYCSVHRTQMQVEADHVVSVRLILRQPSSAWLTFSLEDIRIFPHTEPDPEKEVSDWLSDLTLDDQHPDVEGLPHPQTVSSSIQQMWALTEVMQTNQTTASIGRFDVDGCYDINLLSLT